MAAAMGVAAGWWLVGSQLFNHAGEKFLVDYCREQLAAASLPELPAALQRVALQGSPGYVAIVEQLISEDQDASLATADWIHARLDVLAIQDAGRSATELVELAQAMASPEEVVPDHAKPLLADIAARLIDWPVTLPAEEHGKIVLACGSMIQDAEAQGVLPDNLESGYKNDEELWGEVTAVRKLEFNSVPGELPGITGAEPGLDDTARIGEDPAARPEDESLPNDSDLDSPALADRDIPNALPMDEEPFDTDHNANEPARIEELNSRAAQGKTKSAIPIKKTSAIAPVIDFSALDQVDAIDLLTAYHRSLQQRRNQILKSLRGRGFSDRELEIGLHLTSEDPQVRRQWLDSLPGLSGFDARPWLIRMAKDDDEGVRRSVLAIVATSTDEEIREQLQAIAADDPSQELRDEASKLIEEMQHK